MMLFMREDNKLVEIHLVGYGTITLVVGLVLACLCSTEVDMMMVSIDILAKAWATQITHAGALLPYFQRK